MVYLLLFLSGMAGLIYEMAWSRQLGLLFGHTVHAAAVVLGAYFAGMALGYWIAGQFSPRLHRPIAAYGVAEIVVALWAALTPFLLGGLKTPTAAALLNNPDPALQLFSRAVVVFLILLPATAAMGATLPFVARHLVAVYRLADSRIVLAYSANTVGAVSGVLCATFLLILHIGVVGSNWLAAVISALCGLAAIVYSRRFKTAELETIKPTVETDAVACTNDRPATNGIWFWLAGLSGAGVLGLEVLYTKLFAMVLHNSTYTFGVVIAVFLLALALGSWLVSRYGNRYPAGQVIPLACVAGSLLVLTGVVFFQRFTKMAYFQPGGGFAGYILGVVALCTFVIIPGIILLATILPYCWNQLKQTSRSTAVGRLTAVNTLSASAGALLTSFVLLPLLGLWNGFVLICVLYCLAAIHIALRHKGFSKHLATCLTLFVPIVVAAVLVQQPIAKVYKGTELVFERETPYGHIDVLKKDNGELWLRQNNHYTLGATYGDDSELRQGHIPLLLHENPADVCYLGLATGITASSALMHPEVKNLTAAELIPAVAEAAGLFSEYNMGITERGNVNIVVNDARHFLYGCNDKFDVIVSDLFVPWHSQTGYLYTVEHYRAARQRLKAGGMFCQWVPLYQVSEVELELIANSFAEVFPVVTMWRGEFSGDTPLLALIGSEQTLTIDFSETDWRIIALPDPVSGPDVVLRSAMDLADLYMGDWHQQPGALLNTDEHPRVEFLAPISHRQKKKLTGDALSKYYDDVVFALPTVNLEIRQIPGASPAQPGDNRQRQLGVN